MVAMKSRSVSKEVRKHPDVLYPPFYTYYTRYGHQKVYSNGMYIKKMIIIMMKKKIRDEINQLRVTINRKTSPFYSCLRCV